MARTYVAPGDTIDVVAGVGGVTSGAVVAVGSLIGVAEVSAAEGESFALSLVGVHRLPKTTGAGINVGAKTYWDGNGCTATVGTNTLLGAAVETAGTDDTTALVRLNGATV